MNTPQIRNNEVLAPETIQVRDKIIDKFGDKPLVEMNEFVKNFLRSETDPLNRLGAMAARVFILRHRISIVASEEYDDKKASINEVPEYQDQNSQSSNENSEKDFAKDLGEWVRLKITESSEINGVRFPEGVVIDVKNSDALRLLESKKAVIEEPKAEEPKTEEPKAEEPKAEEPKAEEPKAEELKATEDSIDELSALMNEIEEKNSSNGEKK